MIKKIDWCEYERRVNELENKGLTRTDAQAVVDAQTELLYHEDYSPFETVNS